MNVNKLLEYQNLDLEYAELLKTRNQNPEVSKYLKAKKVRDLSLQSLTKLNNDSKQVYSKMEALLADYKELNEEVDAILESINQIKEDSADEEEIDFLGHRLETLTNEINNLLRDVSMTSDRVVSLRKEYDKDATNATGSRKLMKDLNDKVSQILEEFKPKLDAITAKKDGMKADIDQADLELYEKINSSKKGSQPVIVPLINNTYCGGCMRELSQGQVQEVESKGFAVCQECSRIVYKK